MNKGAKTYLKNIKTSPVLQNSLWGVGSNICQSLLLSLFFICTARAYDTNVFAKLLIATNVYQLITAFSALGLGQWFIREYLNNRQNIELVNKFLKMQLIFGACFYTLNILIVYNLYEDILIRKLSILLGANIIFDNVIYSIKNLNVAQQTQKKTFIVLSIDALLKTVLGITLFIYPISVLALCIFMIVLRFFTLNLFLKLGVSHFVSFLALAKVRIKKADLKHVVLLNWPFIIIGSVSIVFWRIGGIIISKVLDVNAVANYEISFKIFLLAQVVPLILTGAVFPSLNSFAKQKDMVRLRVFFRRLHISHFLYGFLAYTLIYSFSDVLITFAFGAKYIVAVPFVKQMFLVMLIFPTAYLQGNLIVSLNWEKVDMVLNVVSLVVYLAICIIGLHYFKSLAVINYAIFISFFLFQLLQDIFLIKKRLILPKGHVLCYLAFVGCLVGYHFTCLMFGAYIGFVAFWILITVLIWVSSLKDLLLPNETVLINGQVLQTT